MSQTSLSSGLLSLKAGRKAKKCPSFLVLLALSLSLAVVLLNPIHVKAEDEITILGNNSEIIKAEKAYKKLGVGSNIPSTRSSAEKVVKGTLYCIGALLAGLALYSKVKIKEKKLDNPIKILAKQSITNKSCILLVECNNQQFLMGSNADSITMLTTLEDTDSTGFSESLNYILEKQTSKAAIND